ncbi:hypothetical protein LNQ03_15090 [Klebsiella pneumoniae subsp. pneumoniae]|nr:hypothetical protein [Klebsiella pneumoniae subsp. pneumoniae]
MEHRFTSLPPIPLCAAATKSRAAARWRSTPSISVWISNCASPHAMPTSHWHGQVEVNVPFDGDVEYLINNEVVRIEKGYITLFWACTPHQLTRPERLPADGDIQPADASVSLMAAGPGAYQPRHPWDGD